MEAIAEEIKKIQTISFIDIDNEFIKKEKTSDFSFDWYNTLPQNETIDNEYSLSNKSHELISINGKQFKMPLDCIEIIKEIKSSSYILDLQDDWDDNGAIPIKKIVYNTALEFLINYSNALDQKGFLLKTPEINPCRNGSVDLSWRTNNARMLINIQETPKGILAYYYGDINKGDEPIKGNVQTEKIASHLLVWMENLI